MNIESLNPGRTEYTQKNQSAVGRKYTDEQKLSVETRTAQRQDVLQLSDEAKKLQPIVSRLNSGYYDKPEVMQSLAMRISQQFPPEVVGQ
ncbi:MAG: hypothetical protein QG635_1079 [Bacteroidota bacterium]|nr:hypothetical protein [Bacteroidota bacterium]